jgi:PAS domain S-box-containing protein
MSTQAPLGWFCRGAAPSPKGRGGALGALLVFLTCAAAVAAVGLALYLQQARGVRERAAENLADATELTARQIELWVQDRSISLEYAATNPAITGAVRGAYVGDAEAMRSLRGALQMLQRSESYASVAIATLDGHMFAASGEPLTITPEVRRRVAGAQVTGRVVMTNVYVPPDTPHGEPVFDLIVTLDEGPATPPMAVLVARADPARFLSPTLAARPGSLTPMFGLAHRSGGGARILVTRNDEGPANRLEFLDAPGSVIAAQVASGRRDVFEAADYRGVSMLATGRALARTPWYLVAKVDLRAVDAPLQSFGRHIVVLGAGVVLLAALLVGLWWRRESASIALQLDAAEARARRLQEQFAIAGGLVHDLLMLIDARTGRIVEVNDRVLEAYGYTHRELLAMSVFELRLPGTPEADSAGDRFAGVVRRGYGQFNVDHRRKDGSALPLEVSARTMTIDGREYIQAIGRDITERLEHERRVAEIALERDRLLARMQLQFDRMASACIVTDPQGRLLQVNPAFERTFGYRASEVLGKSVTEVSRSPQFHEQVQAVLASLHARSDEHFSGVYDNVRADGAAIVCRWSAAAMRSDDGELHGVVAMADDITELVRTERALRSSERRYRALTDVSPVGIFRADPQGRFVFINAQGRTILGREVGPGATQGWSRAVHPDDVVDVLARWQRYVERGGRDVGSHEFRIVRHRDEVAWLLAQVAPELDANGEPLGFVGTITDVTPIKAAQLALQEAHAMLEQRVRERTQQLEAAKNAAEHSDRVKTAFLSTVSHELRTPLNAILGFTDVLLQGLSGPLTHEQSRQLQIVRDSSSHLRSLVEDVLDISLIEAGQVGLELSPVDLPYVLGRAVARFEREAVQKGVRLEVRLEASLPSLHTDAKRVGQIVGNLLSNAVKFTVAGTVVLGAARVGDHVEISVEDSGVGIPPGALHEIFQPFAHVDRPGGRLRSGTGLGLAISRNLARALGGEILVCSEVGRGSRFTLCLPAAVAVAA